MAPSEGGTQAREILLGVLRSVIRGLMQRKVLPLLASDGASLSVPARLVLTLPDAARRCQAVLHPLESEPPLQRVPS